MVFKAAGVDQGQGRHSFQGFEQAPWPGAIGEPDSRTAGGEVGVEEEIAGQGTQPGSQAGEGQASCAGPGADHIRLFGVIKRCHRGQFSGRNRDS